MECNILTLLYYLFVIVFIYRRLIKIDFVSSQISIEKHLENTLLQFDDEIRNGIDSTAIESDVIVYAYKKEVINFEQVFLEKLLADLKSYCGVLFVDKFSVV